MDERSVPCLIAGKEYPLCLTMRATKAVVERYGGLAEVGDALKAQAIGQQLDELFWLLSLLLREGCDLYNYLHQECELPLTPPPPEILELVLTPGDMVGMRSTMLRCMALGMGRDVPTEDDDAKNPEAGQDPESSSPG